MTKCGFATLIGSSNVGKSTLINALVGAKVSIVSPRVQTTRFRVRGIAIQNDSEVILVDTPGIFKPKKRLEKAMVSVAWEELEYSDLGIVVIDSKRGIDDDTFSILKTIKNKNVAIILNKIDLVKKTRVAELISKIKEIQPFEDIFALSAFTKEGLNIFQQWLFSKIPEGPFLYPEDQISDLPNKLLAAEITREKLFYNLKDELPYVVAVNTDSWQELKNNSVRIEQTIFVEKENQKKIVLGKNGEMVKKIGIQSRIELSKIFDCTIHLFVFVKVKENWNENPELYHSWGLNFNV
ncbi:MAG: GTPase Era [Alphaproteobacteria bacterium]|nr:GTPase Era [Alphaproteobacteria bacterium]